MRLRVGLLLAECALAAGCLCAAVPPCLRVALPPSPTPTPFVSTFETNDAFYDAPTPTPTIVPALDQQEGETELGGAVLKFGEPVLLTFLNQSTARGVLYAADASVVQLRQGDGVISFRREDVASATQF